jgi:hypothetical protein
MMPANEYECICFGVIVNLVIVFQKIDLRER